MMTSLVLCQELRAFLTSIYSVETKALAVSSFGDVINNKNIKIINKFMFEKVLEEYSFLNQRMKNEPHKYVRKLNSLEIAQMKGGQAVLLCSSEICQRFINYNAHLPLAMTNDHIGLDFYTLIIPIKHTYAQEFHKL